MIRTATKKVPGEVKVLSNHIYEYNKGGEKSCFIHFQ